MKVAPVLRAIGRLELNVEPRLIHTGQHYDERMSAVFFDQLGLPSPDVHLGVGSGSHAEQTARVLLGMERELVEHRPDLLVVPGDVNSTLAAALAAVKLNVPVAHLEAGLRSLDETMPEEHNRKLTDHMSKLLLTHSESAGAQLSREGIPAERVHLVGNTMIDSMFDHLATARGATPWLAFGLEERGFALVTLHRPALVDDDRLLTRTIRALADLSRTLPVVLAAHPRTRAHLDRLGLTASLKASQVLVVEPLGYLDFLGLESAAAVVVTDSGGVQEETSALGVPCFTLRSSTERPVTIELGTNTLLGVEPERVAEVADLMHHVRRTVAIPFWDGRAGERAAEVICEWVRREAQTRDRIENSTVG